LTDEWHASRAMAQNRRRHILSAVANRVIVKYGSAFGCNAEVDVSRILEVVGNGINQRHECG